MVLRLLAFNAEAWLAEHLNAYLGDPNEYRAITRNLLHLGGQVAYTPAAITVTLHRPGRPPRPRPAPTHRRTQQHPHPPTRKPTPTDLPGHASP